MRTHDPFDTLRAVPADDTFPAARAWIARAGTHSAAARRRSARLRLAALGVVLLAGACTLPLAQEETVAYLLSGRIALPPGQARQALAALDWAAPSRTTVLGEVMIPRPGGGEEVAAYVGSGEATVNGRKIVTPTSTFAIVLPPADARRVDAWQRSLREIRGVLGVERAPVRSTVRRPAFQAVLERFEFQFDTRLTEAQVEERIQRHLDGVLRGQVRVSHTTGPDGIRTIRLTGEGTLPPEEARRVDAFLRDVQGR